jgi:catechol 2,3-dioxygenase-like lactoylglutathione lyase family enzyme
MQDVTHRQEAKQLSLAGVDHTARPTWKLEETVRFYRDVIGLPLVHAITARGWGPATHPDFLHFFFDSGNGSTIAFFYYLGQPVPADAERPPAKPWPEDHLFDATHTAWLVTRDEDLDAWRQRLVDAGVEVSVEVQHEVVASIYCRDPNGYFVEITRKLRPLMSVDAQDAAATIEAAIELEREAATRGSRIQSVDSVWQRKGQRIAAQLEVTE